MARGRRSNYNSYQSHSGMSAPSLEQGLSRNTNPQQDRGPQRSHGFVDEPTPVSRRTEGSMMAWGIGRVIFQGFAGLRQQAEEQVVNLGGVLSKPVRIQPTLTYLVFSGLKVASKTDQQLLGLYTGNAGARTTIETTVSYVLGVDQGPEGAILRAYASESTGEPSFLEEQSVVQRAFAPGAEPHGPYIDLGGVHGITYEEATELRGFAQSQLLTLGGATVLEELKV